MAQQIAVSPEIDRKWFLLLMFVAAIAACDKAEPKAEEPVAAPTLEGELARVNALKNVRSGLKVAYSAASRASRSNPPARVAPTPGEGGTNVSFVFTANNHGEREDCGCKSNPLGGLGRRHTMIDLARTGGEDAEKWWGKPSTPAENLFVVDAGDLFYKNVTLARAGDWEKKVAKIDAQTVADSIALERPDAYVASENDLVFGLSDLKGLVKRAGLTTISANLYAGGARVFPASTVVERGGVRVGIIGVTKPESRIQNYFSDREVEVKPLVESISAAAAELPNDLDLVVLLSNAGVPDTQAALMKLAEGEVPIDLVFASNSNRLLKAPNWAGGVPIVEPLSRGKWLGRVDLILRGDDVEWVQESSAPDDLQKRYQRAYGAWLNADRRLREAEIEWIEAQIALRDAPTSDAGSAANTKAQKDKPGARPKPNAAFLEKRVETMRRQVGITTEELGKSVAALREAAAKSGEPTTADDEIFVRTQMLKLEIPEEQGVRKIIDRDEKKKPARPAREARKVPARPTKPHTH